MGTSAREMGATRVQTRLQALIRHAKTGEQSDCRSEPRYPFFQPITINRGMWRIAALSRDISMTGIGVLHTRPLPSGRIVVGIPSELGNAIYLLGEVVWRRTFSEGWLASGIRFVEEVESE